MKYDNLVTIALHTGLTESHPLIENFLKSFLICNEYPNIELILIESGSNDDLREWYTNMDFDSEFVNFNGAKTTIKKKDGVNISKQTIFLDFDKEDTWQYCYTESMEQAVEKSKGDYFCYVVEDYQFISVGDTISDHIHVLKQLGEKNSNLCFFTQHSYKYPQATNRPKEGYKLQKVGNMEQFYVFRAAKTKFDPFTFLNKEIYENFGKFKKVTKQEPNAFILDYADKCEAAGWSRYYPLVFSGVHFPNKFNDWALEEIIAGREKDPDYILFKTFDKKDLFDMVMKSSPDSNIENASPPRPFATEDFYSVINSATGREIKAYG
jgi:hypothetical protein